MNERNEPFDEVFEEMIQDLRNQSNEYENKIRSSSINHSHPCCKTWQGTDGIIRQGHFSPHLGSTLGQYIDEDIIKEYTCPRGHSFKTKSPIIVAVDDDPEYNTGPICGYCYVDWFKANLNANEVTENI